MLIRTPIQSSAITFILMLSCASKTDPSGTTNDAATGGAPASVATGGAPASVATGGAPTSVATGGAPASVATGGAPASVATGGAPAQSCMPGVTQACLGPGQCAGAQVCALSGLSWGVCDCGASLPTTGGASSIGGSQGGSPQVATGGATGSPIATCSTLVVPTVTGNLSVAAGYVTVGTLRGYGFTWIGGNSNTATCIKPTCNTAGCQPAFSSTALCAAGIIAADPSYSAMAGVGMNLNQDSAGTIGTFAAPTSITVTAVLGSGSGDKAARIEIVSGSGASAVSYCAESGHWTSGVPIPITTFNTKCWEPATGTPLTVGTALTSLHLFVPSTATNDLPFSMCLTGVSFNP